METGRYESIKKIKTSPNYLLIKEMRRAGLNKPKFG
jgi:hypothetical protein